MALFSCGHKKIKGNRNIETPTSPGEKSGLTTSPEQIGLGARRTKNIKNSTGYKEGVGVGNEQYEGEKK